MQNESIKYYEKAVTELKINTEKILQGQADMQKDIIAIRKDLFDPDNGVYARINRNTAFRKTSSRWMWILTSGFLASLIHGTVRYFLQR
ncbi:hypothetical protein ACFL7D_08395 [candidate division KSB1 bacterium]